MDLFDDDEVPESHRRTLKNAVSIRRVPVAQELIDLGLLRYVEWLRARKATVFFPTLKKDFHGKLSGSFSKFFGRYKRALGITDKRKVASPNVVDEALCRNSRFKRRGHGRRPPCTAFRACYTLSLWLMAVWDGRLTRKQELERHPG